ncbi:MAG: GFA family protein [Rhodospirillaceae bacterium]|nr:GFA family protein [Rhodospirillaceae bacterium]
MKLEGSCHCGAVRFSVESHTPYPFNLCYCSICRKTTGGGGYAINIMGDAATLKVKGKANLSVYRARMNGSRSTGQRHFCKRCGSQLWLYDPAWPQWVYPLAAAIDTKLPAAPERVHLMLGSKANWVPVPKRGRKDRHFREYPKESIEGWHKKRGLYR